MKTQMEQLKTFDSAEISDALDALGIEGALLGLQPITQGKKLVGPVYTVKYEAYDEKQSTEFKNAGNYIDAVPSGSVILLDNAGRTDCTTWGDILTRVAMMNQIAGTVIHGAVRDVSFIREAGYPLYACATYMRSGKNRVYKSAEQVPLTINGVNIRPGDILFADDNGVIVIPLEQVSAVIEKAHNIKLTEDQIIQSVAQGMKLEQARKIHRYDQPWLNAVEK